MIYHLTECLNEHPIVPVGNHLHHTRMAVLTFVSIALYAVDKTLGQLAFTYHCTTVDL